VGLASIGIPENRILQYELALKAEEILLIVHGSPYAVTRAKDIIEGTRHSSYTVHGENILVS